MRDVLRNKESWKGRRAPTQDPSTNHLLSRSRERVVMERLAEETQTQRVAAQQADMRKRDESQRHQRRVQQEGEWQEEMERRARASAETKARPAPFASRSLRRALLMPQVNPGSLYRCGKRT